MKKIFKLFVGILFVFVASTLLFKADVNAKTTVVSSSEMKSFDKMVDALWYPITMIVDENNHFFVRSGQTDKLNFSKARIRRNFLYYRSAFQTIYSSIDFFGKKTINDDHFIYGDWGEYYPLFKNKEIYKIGKSKYRINLDVCFEDCSSGGRIDTLASAVIYVKPNKKSALKYNITKIVLNYK